MNAPFVSYLDLLRELSGNLDQLSQLAQEKIASVHKDDLIGLNDVLKQEQAMSLNLRGLEQRRQKLVSQLDLADVPLTALAGRCPEELRAQARQTSEELRRSYSIYRSYADAARSTLELNIHEIEKVIAASGGNPAETGSGYDAPGVEPPKNMKSDFRA